MSLVYIISAPSGSGKSTLVNELRKLVRDLVFSISYTTRPLRGSEQNGREYFFISRPEFEAMIRKGDFLECAEVFGNYYGTARSFLVEAEHKGHDLLLDIDVQGAEQIKRKIILVNDRLEESTEALRAIVLSERFRRSGTKLSEDEIKLSEMAGRFRLDKVQERVRPIIASFAKPMAQGEH